MHTRPAVPIHATPVPLYYMLPRCRPYCLPCGFNVLSATARTPDTHTLLLPPLSPLPSPLPSHPSSPCIHLHTPSHRRSSTQLTSRRGPPACRRWSGTTTTAPGWGEQRWRLGLGGRWMVPLAALPPVRHAAAAVAAAAAAAAAPSPLAGRWRPRLAPPAVAVLQVLTAAAARVPAPTTVAPRSAPAPAAVAAIAGWYG